LLYGDGSNLSGISGGSSTSYNSFTANFDVSASYDVMGINSSGSVVTASLAAANTYTAGQRLIFKDIEGSGLLMAEQVLKYKQIMVLLS
jgi:hypothetical protein